MKPVKVLLYLIVMALLLTILNIVSTNIAFIPRVNTIVFVVIFLVCVWLAVIIISGSYRSMSRPLKVKQWLFLILSTILLLGGILFGVLLASVGSKAEGLFTTYVGKHKFKKVTFYIYSSDLLGTTLTVRYSERGEIVSHKIDNLYMGSEVDSIHIQELHPNYILRSPKRKYLFSIQDKSVTASE